MALQFAVIALARLGIHIASRGASKYIASRAFSTKLRGYGLRPWQINIVTKLLVIGNNTATKEAEDKIDKWRRKSIRHGNRRYHTRRSGLSGLSSRRKRNSRFH